MEKPLYLVRSTETLKLWSVSSGECLKTFHGHSSTMYRNVAFSPDGRTVVSGSGARQNFETVVCFLRRVSQDFPGPQQRCTTVWLSVQMEGPLYLARSTRTLKLWSVSGGECLKTFQGHSNYVFDVAFSPDGRTVVSGSIDKYFETVVCFWWKVSQDFPGPQQLCTTVWLSVQMEGPLYLAHPTMTLKLWSVSSGECLKTFRATEPLGTQCGIQSRWKDQLYLARADNTLKICGMSPQESVSRLSRAIATG